MRTFSKPRCHVVRIFLSALPSSRLRTELLLSRPQRPRRVHSLPPNGIATRSRGFVSVCRHSLGLNRCFSSDRQSRWCITSVSIAPRSRGSTHAPIFPAKHVRLSHCFDCLRFFAFSLASPSRASVIFELLIVLFFFFTFFFLSPTPSQRWFDWRPRVVFPWLTCTSRWSWVTC